MPGLNLNVGNVAANTYLLGSLQAIVGDVLLVRGLYARANGAVFNISR